jgi:hypothetical protein
MAIKMNTNYSEIEKILKSAIYENKMELINPSKEYESAQISFMKGYICCLEDLLKEIEIMSNNNQENTYKVCLN